MSRMSGQEFTAWIAFFNVKAREAEEARDIVESGDGIVHVYGAEGAEEDREEDGYDDDGETE